MSWQTVAQYWSFAMFICRGHDSMFHKKARGCLRQSLYTARMSSGISVSYGFPILICTTGERPGEKLSIEFETCCSRLCHQRFLSFDSLSKTLRKSVRRLLSHFPPSRAIYFTTGSPEWRYRNSLSQLSRRPLLV